MSRDLVQERLQKEWDKAKAFEATLLKALNGDQAASEEIRHVGMRKAATLLSLVAPPGRSDI